MPARPDNEKQRNTGLAVDRSDYCIVVRSEAFGVRKALLDVTGFAARRGIGKNDLRTLELVLAEVLNNIVEHACHDRQGSEIKVSCKFAQVGAQMRVTDNGAPLQGGIAPDSVLPRPNGDIETLPEGGFGWFIIRRLTQNLTYRRRNGRNCLVFTIPFQGI